MDILNFISWIKTKRVVTTLSSNALIPVGELDVTRDDKYLTVIITKENLLKSTVPITQNIVATNGDILVYNSTLQTWSPVKNPKRYSALLTQTSATAPVSTIQTPNTIGTIVWAYVSSGIYTGTLANAFVAGKTIVTGLIPNNTNALSNFTITVTSASQITLNTNVLSVSAGTLINTPTNGRLLNTAITIEVYP